MANLMVMIAHWQMSIEPDLVTAEAGAVAAAGMMYQLTSVCDDEEASDLTWVRLVAIRWYIEVTDASRCHQSWMKARWLPGRQCAQLGDCDDVVSLEVDQSWSAQDMTVDREHSKLVGSGHVHHHLACLHWIASETSHIHCPDTLLHTDHQVTHSTMVSKGKVSFEPRGPLGGADLPSIALSHQLTKQDHRYGASASHAVPVNFPAVRPVPNYTA